jgi:hypothetical protein
MSNAKQWTRFITTTLAAGFVAICLAGHAPVRSDDSAHKNPAHGPGAQPAPPDTTPLRRFYVEAIDRPGDQGNARVRVDAEVGRTVSLNLDRLDADQKRYADDLIKAKKGSWSSEAASRRAPTSKSYGPSRRSS